MAKTVNGGLDPDSYKQSIKLIDDLLKKQKGLEKSTDNIKSAWQGISSTIFGVSGSDWFDKVPKTTEEIAKQFQQLSEIQNLLKGIGKTLDKSVNDEIKEMSQELGSTFVGLQDNLEGFANSFKGKSDIIGKMLQDASGQLSFSEAEETLRLIEKNSKKIFAKGSKDRKELNALIAKSKLDEQEITKSLKDREIKSEEYYQKLLKNLPEISQIEDEQLKKKFLIALANDDISGFLKEHKELGLSILATNERLFRNVGDQAGEFINVNKQVDELEKELKNTEKEVFKISKGLMAMAKNIASGIIAKMLEFDKIIHDTQKTTGIMFTENAAAMSTLVRKTSEFGMSIQDTAEFMGTLGDELRTTDFGVLSKAADDLKAIQLATGISAENLSTMAGEMMRNGKSSAQVAESMADANIMAKTFGVNSKKVLEGMSRNINKMRTMGFVGGEKSLMKMVATAERLRMNVDEIFDVAKKARQIEGAMEMAAELQLAGGSFANINPMDLLASARKGPAELQKILTKMGGDIGHFDKETKEYKFDPVDVDRLQIVADTTGLTLDSIQKMIQKNAEDNQKIQYMPNITFDGLKDKDGKPIDPDSIKNTLLDAVDMTGQALDGSVLDKAGIKNLADITQEQAQKIMEDQIAKEKNLEKQAKENQGFEDALTALKGAFMNMFTYLEPVVEVFTKVFQGISKFLNAIGPFAPILLALIAAMAILPMLTAALGKAAFAMNPKNLGAIFKSGGIKQAMMNSDSEANPMGTATDVANKSNAVKPGAGAGLLGFAKTLEKVFKTAAKYDLMGIAKFTLAITALLVPLAGIALLFGALGGDPLILLALGAALVGMAYSMKMVGETKVDLKNILIMALAMIAIGIALIPFSVAAQMLSEVNMGGVIIALVLLMAAVIILMEIGGMLTGPQIAYLAVALAVMIVIAVSLVIFAYAMQLLAVALAKMAEIDAMALGKIMIVLALMAPVLIALGVVGAIFAIPIIILAAALAILGPALMILSAGLNALSTVNWTAFNGVGASLMALAGGLALFALAGLLFVNPIMLIGMMLMIGTLAAISIVLVPLANALDLGGKGIDSMASGVMKLSDSLQKLDLEKLGQLKEFSQSMTLASLAGGAMTAMVAVIEAIGKIGGGGSGSTTGGSGTKTVVIKLMMPNGRELQQVIIEDIDKVS